MDPQATAGRIVHYMDATERTTAAIVCVDAAPNGLAALMTFFPGKAPVPMRQVPYSEESAPGCWSWMPYQKAKADRPGGNQSESAEPRPGSFEDFARRIFKVHHERIEALEDRVRFSTDEAKVKADIEPAEGGPDPEGAQGEPDEVLAEAPPIPGAEVPGPAPTAPESAPAAADGQEMPSKDGT